jgi:hypothetical protein
MLLPMRIFRALVMLALGLACQGFARAQIITADNSGEARPLCMGGGLSSHDCGTRAHWYSYVFVGSISAITPKENDEKELQIVPEELFLGAPPASLTVSTSGAPCLRELTVGDHWLFYLRKANDSPIVLQYGSDSVPVEDAVERIDTLRRLKTIGDFAIVRGEVWQGYSFSGKAVPDAKITARRVSDGRRFLATTDADGKYEFQPLPAGKYELVADPTGSFQADENSVDVVPGACWDVTLSRSAQAEIRGRVTRSDGSPLSDVEVLLIASESEPYHLVETQSDGSFVFERLQPGDFVVGLNFPPRSDDVDAGSTLPPASVFYPGVANRSEARVIRLTTDEKMEDVNFTIPVE